MRSETKATLSLVLTFRSNLLALNTGEVLYLVGTTDLSLRDNSHLNILVVCIMDRFPKEVTRSVCIEGFWP